MNAVKESQTIQRKSVIHEASQKLLGCVCCRSVLISDERELDSPQSGSLNRQNEKELKSTMEFPFQN